MGGIKYATREDVKDALDSAATARNNAQVDRALDGATRSIDGLTRRQAGHFRPHLDTRYKEWPPDQSTSSRRLWLDADELISVATLTSGGIVVGASDFFLEPANDGPPFTHIEIDQGSNAAWTSGDTNQRSIEIVGLWGHSNEEEPVGELAGTLADVTSATASISWSTSRIGVGDVLRINSERMIVTGRTMVDSTQNLATPMTSAANSVTVAVTNGAAFAVEQVILLDSERMLIVDIAGNNLTVKRAYDGSVLAAHSGSDVYTLTGIDIDRAQLGTTIAEHLSGAVIYRHLVPALIRQLAVAEALVDLGAEQSGYSRTVRSGDAEMFAGSIGVGDLRKRVRREFARRARSRAV